MLKYFVYNIFEVHMVGVSPAYFISRFGEGFTPSDIAASLADIAAIGGTGYQLELFREDGDGEWTDAAVNKIRDAETKTGLRATQFVAHYFLHGFADPDSLASDRGFAAFARVLAVCAAFPTVDTITIPLPPFDAGGEVGRDQWKRLRTALEEKLRKACALAAERGFRVALELVPGNILGSPEQVIALRGRPGLERIGYNFDTGHAWACRERVDLLPAKLEGAIYGTHLKDNTQEGKLALAPGKGNIDWARVVGGLLESGYDGAWDVEFICAASDTQTAYADGIAVIKEALRARGALK